MTHFRKALQIKPDDEETHLDLGKALLQKGAVAEAILNTKRCCNSTGGTGNPKRSGLAFGDCGGAIAARRRQGGGTGPAGQSGNRRENPVVLHTLAAARRRGGGGKSPNAAEAGAARASPGGGAIQHRADRGVETTELNLYEGRQSIPQSARRGSMKVINPSLCLFRRESGPAT